jgi:hypothetical protein
LVAQGLAAGTSLEAVLARALEEGMDPCGLVKAAVMQDVELARLFTFFLARFAADPELAGRCTLCLLLRCAVEQGKDVVETANAMMSAGANLAQVRACLGAMGFEGSAAYTYTPADPPALVPAVVPAFPGNGGGSISADEDPSPAS